MWYFSSTSAVVRFSSRDKAADFPRLHVMQVFGVQLGNLASVAGATVNSRWQLVQTNRMASDHSRMKVHDPRHRTASGHIWTVDAGDEATEDPDRGPGRRGRPGSAVVIANRRKEKGGLMPQIEYTAMLLGATGNVGASILGLLVQSPLCKKAVVVTRRPLAELADPKVQQVVVNMDTLEEELAPHAKGIDIALAAFGVGKGSAKMADEEVRKIESPTPRPSRLLPRRAELVCWR